MSDEREVLETCRYYKSQSDVFEVCTKDDTRNPDCRDCDVDHRADLIYNSSFFHQNFITSSPRTAEEALEYIQKMHKLIEEGEYNAKTSRK